MKKIYVNIPRKCGKSYEAPVDLGSDILNFDQDLMYVG